MKTEINIIKTLSLFLFIWIFWFLTADFDSFYAYITKPTKKEVPATKSYGATWAEQQRNVIAQCENFTSAQEQWFS